MRLALSLGIPAARSRVASFGDETALVVERYDRFVAGGRLLRVHQEDLCQALGRSRTRRYESEGGPGCRDITVAIRSLCRRPGDRAQLGHRRHGRAAEVGLPPGEVLAICESLVAKIRDRYADIAQDARAEGLVHPIVDTLVARVATAARACLENLRR